MLKNYAEHQIVKMSNKIYHSVKKAFQLQLAPLNGITLGPTQTDSINQMIPLPTHTLVD